MVICFLKKSAQRFMEQKSFEVDMTFRRIWDGKFNEIVFAALLPETNKSKS